MNELKLNKEDFPSLVRILTEWLDKNATRVNPVMRDFILYSLSEDAVERLWREQGTVYKILRLANLVSYEEEVSTIFVPKEEKAESLMEDYELQ